MDNYVEIKLFYGTSRITVREQYYTYGFGSFVADIGGYLGLLLGNSILGFYDGISGIYEKCRFASGKGVRK